MLGCFLQLRLFSEVIFPVSLRFLFIVVVLRHVTQVIHDIKGEGSLHHGVECLARRLVKQLVLLINVIDAPVLKLVLEFMPLVILYVDRSLTEVLCLWDHSPLVVAVDDGRVDPLAFVEVLPLLRILDLDLALVDQKVHTPENIICLKSDDMLELSISDEILRLATVQSCKLSPVILFVIELVLFDNKLHVQSKFCNQCFHGGSNLVLLELSLVRDVGLGFA